MRKNEISDPLFSSVITNFELLHPNEVPYHYLMYTSLTYIYIYYIYLYRNLSLHNLGMRYTSDRRGGQILSLDMGTLLMTDLQQIHQYQLLDGKQVSRSLSLVAPHFQVYIFIYLDINIYIYIY